MQEEVAGGLGRIVASYAANKNYLPTVLELQSPYCTLNQESNRVNRMGFVHALSWVDASKRSSGTFQNNEMQIMAPHHQGKLLFNCSNVKIEVKRRATSLLQPGEVNDGIIIFS